MLKINLITIFRVRSMTTKKKIINLTTGGISFDKQDTPTVRCQQISARYYSSKSFRNRRIGQKDSTVVLEEMVSTLIKALSSKEVQVRAGAALELGRLGIEKAIPALCEALSTDQDPSVRRSVAEALGMIGRKETEASNNGD
jgi:hypothetical protein